MKRIAAIFLFLISTQAMAAFFSDSEAHQKIEALDKQTQAQMQQRDERILQLDSQIKQLLEQQKQQEANNKRTLELLNQIEKLKEDIAGLRGKIEVLQFNLDEAVKRQRDLYLDLDTRLRNLETRDAAREQASAQEQKVAQQAAQQAAALAAQQSTEQKQIDAAAVMIKAGKNKEGVAALNKFMQDTPQTTRRAEANYWLGVGYTALRDFKSARTAFNEIVNKFAEDPRSPDALLGLATVAATQKDDKLSRRYLAIIVEKYPESEAAVTARKVLGSSK